MSDEHKRTGVDDANAPELRRRGDRSNVGADTPSGPMTDRTVKPAKREQARRKADENKRDEDEKR